MQAWTSIRVHCIYITANFYQLRDHCAAKVILHGKHERRLPLPVRIGRFYLPLANHLHKLALVSWLLNFLVNFMHAHLFLRQRGQVCWIIGFLGLGYSFGKWICLTIFVNVDLLDDAWRDLFHSFQIMWVTLSDQYNVFFFAFNFAFSSLLEPYCVPLGLCLCLIVFKFVSVTLLDLLV